MVNIFLYNETSVVNVFIQLSSTNFCIYISLYLYFLFSFNVVSKCVIVEHSREGLKTELSVQMEVRKQKLFVRTARNESGFVEMATLVWIFFLTAVVTEPEE
jgi:hypothetical protein